MSRIDFTRAAPPGSGSISPDVFGQAPATVLPDSQVDLLMRVIGAIESSSVTESAVAGSVANLTANVSGVLLAPNVNRVSFTIHNLSTTDALYIRYGSAASSSAGGYKFALPANSQYISDPREWTGEIQAVIASNATVSVSESV